MEDETLKELIKSAKAECKITWSDPTTDLKVKEMVEDTCTALKMKLGIKDDANSIFLVPGQERMLWKNYVMYAWSDTTAYFDENYKHEIMQARRKYEVRHAQGED